MLTRGRSSAWLERLPVTQEVASSSLVGPALKSLNTSRIEAFFISVLPYNPTVSVWSMYGLCMEYFHTEN